MVKSLVAVSLVLTVAFAAEKRPPQGQAENDAVAVTATFISQDEVRQEFGTAFGGSFTVIEVRLAPKGGKPYDVHLDDFILRSESDGDHSGPLASSQVIDGGALVVKQTFAPRSNPEMAPMVAGTKVEMKDDLGRNDIQAPSQLDALKKRILAEKTTTDAESGLLFFPLEKKKARSLVLSCTTPGGKLRIQFK